MEEKIVSIDALEDTRPVVLKEKDYSTEELASDTAAAIKPFQNERPLKVTATEYNQWYVGSCVPHGFWTQLEYEGIIDKSFNPSQLRSYRKRSNYPAPGSNGVDMYLKIQEGQSNDFPTPEKFREAQATAMPLIVGTKQIKDFKFFQYLDKATFKILYDAIPVDIALGKAVTIFVYASDDEWSQRYVEAKDEVSIGSAEVRHCVCVIPKGDFTKDGKRWLTVQDSAKFGKLGMRYLEFDTFFKSRVYFAAKVYLTEAIPKPEPVPTPKPTVACQLNDKNAAVLALQNFLIQEGKLKAEYATGFYGALTAKAVLWWQLENWNKFTSTIPELLDLGGKNWGPQSISIIN